MAVHLKRPPYRREIRTQLLGAACAVRDEMRKYRIEDDDEEMKRALAHMKAEDTDRYARMTAELIELREQQIRMLREAYATYRNHLVQQELQ